MRVHPGTRLARQGDNKAFTIVDLTVLLAVVALLAAMLLPALNKTRVQAETSQCLNNVKQLAGCWTMYTHENQGKLPPNYLASPKAWVNHNVATPYGATNESAIRAGVLFSYNHSLSIYKCPGAKTLPEGIRSIPSSTQTRLVRNYSIQGRMGGANPLQASMHGVADTSWVLTTKYPQYQNISEIKFPSPAEATVFVDESNETIDDGFFAVNYNFPQEWQNTPGIRHGQGTTFSFADGHAEYWRWRGMKRDYPLGYLSSDEFQQADLIRLKNSVFRKD